MFHTLHTGIRDPDGDVLTRKADIPRKGNPADEASENNHFTKFRCD